MESLEFNRLQTELREPAFLKGDTYLNSAVYYAATGRAFTQKRDIQVFRGYGSLVIVCEHPNINNRLLVFPEVGPGSQGRLLASVLSMLVPPKGGIQLARFQQSELDTLNHALAQLPATPVETIVPEREGVLDWRYPSYLLDTDAVSEMKGNRFRNVRREFNRATDTVEIMPLEHVKAHEALKIALKSWESWMRFHDKSDLGDITGYYMELFEMLRSQPGTLDGFITIQNRIPVGFSLWEQPLGEVCNSFANTTDTSRRGISEFQIVTTCRILRERGVKLYNFAGSESGSDEGADPSNLDGYKRKFRPAGSVELLSARVNYRRFRDTNISVQKLVA